MSQRLHELRVRVLHPVPLADDDVLPLDLAQHGLILHHELERGEQHVELAARHLLALDLLAHTRRALVDHHPDVRGPLDELVGPVGQRGERHHDQERAIILLHLHDVGDQRDRLDGLAQAHLVGQDAVEVVVVQGDHPLQALQLVCLQVAALEHGRLPLDHLLVRRVGLKDRLRRHGARAVDRLAADRGGLLLGRRVALGRVRLGLLFRVLLVGLHQVRDALEVLVRLLQQEVQALVLGLLHQLVVGLHVVRLQRLEPRALRAVALPRQRQVLGLELHLDGLGVPRDRLQLVLVVRAEVHVVRLQREQEVTVLLAPLLLVLQLLLALLALGPAHLLQRLLARAPVVGALHQQGAALIRQHARAQPHEVLPQAGLHVGQLQRQQLRLPWERLFGRHRRLCVRPRRRLAHGAAQGQ